MSVTLGLILGPGESMGKCLRLSMPRQVRSDGILHMGANIHLCLYTFPVLTWCCQLTSTTEDTERFLTFLRVVFLADPNHAGQKNHPLRLIPIGPTENHSTSTTLESIFFGKLPLYSNQASSCIMGTFELPEEP